MSFRNKKRHLFYFSFDCFSLLIFKGRAKDLGFERFTVCYNFAIDQIFCFALTDGARMPKGWRARKKARSDNLGLARQNETKNSCHRHQAG